MEWFFILVIGFLVWAAIGHLFWRILTWPFSLRNTKPCSQCGRSIDIEDLACRHCGWTSVPLDLKQSLVVCRQALDAAFKRELIDQEGMQRGLDILVKLENRTDQQRVQGVVEQDVGVSKSPSVTVPKAPVVAPKQPDAVAISKIKEAQVHALDRDYEAPVVAASPAKKEPTRTWTQLLSAFMEESNIRWGEIIGGLLIVCCSTALVMSFWEHIASRPWLKFSIFTGINVSTFGLGLYAWHRWKLPTTSKGILIIGMMQMPLNFLAFALFTMGMPWDWLTVAGELLSMAILGYLAYLASIILTPGAVAVTTCTPVLFGLANLLIRRTVGQDAPFWMLYAWAFALIATYISTVVLARRPLISNALHRYAPALEFFALSTFGVLLSFGLLLRCSGHPVETVRLLSPLLTLLACPALLLAIEISRKLESQSSLRVPMLLMGTAAVALGGLAMLFSWPAPLLMIASGAGLLVMLAVIAKGASNFGFIQPASFVASVLILLVWYGLASQVPWMNRSSTTLLDRLMTPLTGFIWVGYSLFLLALSALVSRINLGSRWDVATSLMRSALLTGGLGTILLTVFGFGREAYSTSLSLIYVLYAIAAFCIGSVKRKPWMEYIAIAFLASASFQSIVVGWTDFGWMDRIYASLLAVSIALLIAMMIQRACGMQSDPDEPIVSASLLSVIAFTGIAAIQSTSFAPLLSASLLWLIYTWLHGNRIYWTITQWVAVSSLVAGVIHSCRQASWWPSSSSSQWLGLVHPNFLQYVALGFLVVGICLVLLDQLLRRITSQPATAIAGVFKQLHDSSVARALIGSATVLTLGLMVYGAIPGVTQEIIPRDAIAKTQMSTYVQDGVNLERPVPDLGALEVRGIPHEAASWGVESHRYRVWGVPPLLATWCMGLAGLLLVCWDLRNKGDVGWRNWAGLLAALVIGLWYPLATLAEPSVAVASALRWITALVLFLACLLLSLWISRVDRSREPYAGLSFAFFDEIFNVFSVFTFLPWALMGTIVTVSVLMQLAQIPMIGGLGTGFIWGCTLVMALAALAMVVTRNWLAANDSAATSHSVMGSTLWTIAAPTLLLSPLLAWTLLNVAVTVISHPLTGPDPDSMFAKMGLAISYATPILLIAIGLVMVAVSRPSPRLAFIAALFLMTSIVAGTMLILKARALQIETWIGLCAMLSATASLYGLAWQAIVARNFRADTMLHWPGRPIQEIQHRLQTALSQISAGFAIVGLSQIFVLVLMPKIASPGMVWGSAGVLIAILLHFAQSLYRLEKPHLGPWIAAAGIAGMGIVSPNFTAVSWAFGSSSLVILTAGVAILVDSLRSDSKSANPVMARIALGTILAVATSISLRIVLGCFPAVMTTKAQGAVSLFTLIGACMLAFAATWIHKDRWTWIWGLVLAHFAGVSYSIWFMNVGNSNAMPFLSPVFLQIAIAASATAFATWCGFGRKSRIPLVLGTITLFALSALWFLLALSRTTPVFNAGWYAMAILACLVGGVTGFWNPRSKDEHTVIYLAGLCGSIWILQVTGATSSMFLWLSTIVLAAYCLASSFLWSSGERIQEELTSILRIPRALDKPRSMLLVPLNILLALGVTVLGVMSQWYENGQNLRLLSANAILAVVFAIGFLARYASYRGSTTPIRVLALVVGSLYAVALFWHLQDNQTRLIDRLAVMPLPLVLVSGLYGFGLIKWFGGKFEWEKAGSQVVPWIVGLAIALGASLVLYEIQQANIRGLRPMEWYGAICMIGSLIASLFLCLAAALLPGKDPLGLSQRGRESYVYAAQAIFVLLIIHLRITMPFLFGGWLQSIWPLLAVAIGFAGVGMAQWSERRGLSVLANPLFNSGSLLPLLPILSPWIAPSGLDQGITMMMSAVGYGLFGYMRSSPIYTTASILCGNIAFWQILSKNQMSFIEHPQLWVIPPALCVFAAGQIFKDRLTTQQLASVRYLSVGSIYVASTSEMFLQGIAKAPWLPIVLAFLSVVGILVGIAVRIRSMLWLGSMFLAVAMLSILWYAAVDLQQTWLWYVCGIVLGAAMLFVFAMFEKRKEDLKRIVSNMQSWEE